MIKFLKIISLSLSVVCALSFGIGYYKFGTASNALQTNQSDIKNNESRNIESRFVALGGTPFGMKIFTEGVMIVGMSSVETKDGLVNPAEQAGVEKGDIIIKMNGVSVHSNADVSEIIENSDGKLIRLKIKRKGKTLFLSFYPQKSIIDGVYKAGLWVRDSSAGIGTMTFYVPQSSVFAGLGHAVCDIDTGNILPLSNGEIVKTEIYSVNKSRKGDVGELCGCFIEESLGTMSKNNETGVYGKLYNCDYDPLIEVALQQEVKVGQAQIFTTIKGKAKYYDCYVENVNEADDTTQNMIIKITDERLIRKTGGIVQGMSGSPIIQNGKLIGAVTHVLVDNPQKGYAIFAEDMLQTAQSVAVEQFKEAS